MPDDPPILEAKRNPAWFDAPLSEAERWLVGEYDTWQGPAASRATLHPDRRLTGFGIVPIPGKWRVSGDFLLVRIDTGDLLVSRKSPTGNFYGDVPLRRVKAYGPAARPLEILKAEYGAGDRWHDATQAVKGMINGNRLVVTADNNSLAGGWDPASGVPKVLKISYMLGGERHDDEVGENLILRVQEDDIARSWVAVPSSSWAPRVRYRVVTFYMDNTHDVAAAQKRVFDRLGCPIDQVKTYHKHGVAVDEYLANRGGEFDYVLLFDVDAIPMNRDAIPTLLANIALDDRLVGPAASSNHINHDHLFAGAACLGLSMRVWDGMGRPTLRGCWRSDTSEELTWAAEEDGLKIGLMWPSAVEEPVWVLGPNGRYGRIGYGTTYQSSDGVPVVYHAFECRFGCQRFLNKCEEVIKSCP